VREGFAGAGVICMRHDQRLRLKATVDLC
jgi:hypothetical protein